MALKNEMTMKGTTKEGISWNSTTKEGISWNIPEGWGSASITIASPGVKKISYKYNEGVYIKEITDYINSTYSEHYSRNKFQATEFIMDSGHGTGFCMGNVLKYAQRYGRKGSREDWRKDLLKVIHYAMMQLYVHDIVNKETI